MLESQCSWRFMNMSGSVCTQFCRFFSGLLHASLLAPAFISSDKDRTHWRDVEGLAPLCRKPPPQSSDLDIFTSPSLRRLDMSQRPIETADYRPPLGGSSALRSQWGAAALARRPAENWWRVSCRCRGCLPGGSPSRDTPPLVGSLLAAPRASYLPALAAARPMARTCPRGPRGRCAPAMRGVASHGESVAHRAPAGPQAGGARC